MPPTLLGRVGDLLKLLAAELLIGLSLQDVPVLGSGLVQSLVGIFVVHKRATAAVQEVLAVRGDREGDWSGHMMTETTDGNL